MKHQINDIQADIDLNIPTTEIVDVMDRLDETIDKVTDSALIIIAALTASSIVKSIFRKERGA